MGKLKTLFQKRKIALSVAAVAAGALLLLSGLTGAWWYKTGTGTSDLSNPPVINMGKLALSATLAGDADGTWETPYEPGSDAYWGSLTVTNSGTCTAFVKFSVTSDTKFVSDANGEALDPSNYHTETNDTNVSLDFDEDCLGYSDNDNYAWFTDGNGTYFLMIPSGATVDAAEAVTVHLNGPGMENDYFNAIITVRLQWEATQFNPTGVPVLAKLGVNFSDLIAIDNDLDA